MRPRLALVRRTSDWNGPPEPLTCVTTGMISALPGGRFLLPGETGVTRLTETGTLVVWPVLVVTVTVPVLAPGGRLPGAAVTLRSTLPDAGMLPAEGVTVR